VSIPDHDASARFGDTKTVELPEGPLLIWVEVPRPLTLDSDGQISEFPTPPPVRSIEVRAPGVRRVPIDRPVAATTYTNDAVGGALAGEADLPQAGRYTITVRAKAPEDGAYIGLESRG
jgi:hypothetical protein